MRKKFINAALFLAGASLVAGFAMVYIPAGFIVGGLVVVGGCLFVDDGS